MPQLTRQLLAKGNTVIATARDPGAAKDLQKLQAGSGGALTVMQLDVGSPESIDAWAGNLKHQVAHIDVSGRKGMTVSHATTYCEGGAVQPRGVPAWRPTPV